LGGHRTNSCVCPLPQAAPRYSVYAWENNAWKEVARHVRYLQSAWNVANWYLSRHIPAVVCLECPTPSPALPYRSGAQDTLRYGLWACVYYQYQNEGDYDTKELADQACLGVPDHTSCLVIDHWDSTQVEPREGAMCDYFERRISPLPSPYPTPGMTPCGAPTPPTVCPAPCNVVAPRTCCPEPRRRLFCR
jgi:hypothetical protein